MNNETIFGYDFNDILNAQQVRGRVGDSIEATRKTRGDYGKDPLGNGMFKMVPSGRIVTLEEAKQILGR